MFRLPSLPSYSLTICSVSGYVEKKPIDLSLPYLVFYIQCHYIIINLLPHFDVYSFHSLRGLGRGMAGAMAICDQGLLFLCAQGQVLAVFEETYLQRIKWGSAMCKVDALTPLSSIQYFFLTTRTILCW